MEERETARSGTPADEPRDVSRICDKPDSEMVGAVYEMLDKQKDKNIPVQSRKNCISVLGSDPVLSGKIKFNTLSNRKNVEGALPWNKSEGLRDWTNIDTEYLIFYMEEYYSLSCDKKILSALELVADANKFNPFIDMLNSVVWDGKPRIENLLTDYLGVEKSEYSAQCMRLLMLGAICRAFKPGTKFDYILVLTGPQGIGKSTFFMKVCGNEDWYLENLNSITRDKEAAELLLGKVIVEFNELLAARGSTERVKAFVTVKADEYRGAYAREKEKHKRTCVFVGTTNDTQFLVDKTGNRRFLPVKCGVVPVKKSLFADDETLQNEFKQAWAEAYHIYKSENGKPSLVMPEKLQGYIEDLREDFKEDDPMVGMIQYWLDTHNYDCVCNKQIASEVLKVDDPDQRLIKQIANIMNNSITGWKRKGWHRFPKLGRQKCYVKTRDFTEAYQEEIPFKQ